MVHGGKQRESCKLRCKNFYFWIYNVHHYRMTAMGTLWLANHWHLIYLITKELEFFIFLYVCLSISFSFWLTELNDELWMYSFSYEATPWKRKTTSHFGFEILPTSSKVIYKVAALKQHVRVKKQRCVSQEYL